MELDATIERLRRRAVEYMRDRGQGEEWTIEGNPNEQVDFDFEYPVVPVPHVSEIDVFLKHLKIRIRTDESWMDVSERMVRHFGFPKGTTFRIFPVDNVIFRMGDDHAYSFEWKENGQYWCDIDRDPSTEISVSESKTFTNHLLVRCETPTSRFQERRREMADIEHFLDKDWRFSGFVHGFKNVASDPSRDH
jgi:hypothetical protein